MAYDSEFPTYVLAAFGTFLSMVQLGFWCCHRRTHRRFQEHIQERIEALENRPAQQVRLLVQDTGYGQQVLPIPPPPQPSAPSPQYAYFPPPPPLPPPIHFPSRTNIV